MRKEDAEKRMLNVLRRESNKRQTGWDGQNTVYQATWVWEGEVVKRRA